MDDALTSAVPDPRPQPRADGAGPRRVGRPHHHLPPGPGLRTRAGEAAAATPAPDHRLVAGGRLTTAARPAISGSAPGVTPQPPSGSSKRRWPSRTRLIPAPSRSTRTPLIRRRRPTGSGTGGSGAFVSVRTLQQNRRFRPGREVPYTLLFNSRKSARIGWWTGRGNRSWRFRPVSGP